MLLAVDVLPLVAEELVRVLERPDAVPHIVVDVARVLLRINRARRRSAAELMERSATALVLCLVGGGRTPRSSPAVISSSAAGCCCTILLLLSGLPLGRHES